MARHLYSIVCRKVIVDKESNAISTIEIAETFEIGGIPNDQAVGVPLSLEMVSFWERSDRGTPETGRTRLSLAFPDGSSVAGGESEIDLVPSYRARTIVRMSGIPVKGSGVHHFGVELQDRETGRWTEVTRFPVEIVIAGTAPHPAATGVAGGPGRAPA